MRFGLTGLFLLFSAVAAVAEPISADRIIDGATGDWDKDGQQDLALLVAPAENGDDIGIYIYLRDKDHALLKPIVEAPKKVWGNASLDGLFGQAPSIEALANGSIAVHSQNSGIGRERWEQMLTLAYRNGHFIVAGYSYNYYDTLDQNNNGSCDYNLLAGRLAKNSKTLKADAKTVKIEDWNDDIGQDVCGFKTAE